MINIFDIKTIFFTFLGYPMSYLEFFGTIFNIWSVALVARKNIWNWPIGNIGVVLFLILFYQIRLYSDFFEQIFYLASGFYGWWVWWKLSKKSSSDDLQFSFSSKKTLILISVLITFLTIILGNFMANIHIYFPSYFPEPASFPILDAFTTVLSFVATALMVYKKIESWILWIIVDIIGIGLYFVKDVRLISILYGLFLILAINGLKIWYQTWKKSNQNSV